MFRILIYLLAAYGLLVIYAYFFSDYKIFPVPDSSYRDSSRIIKIKVSDKNKISAIYFPNKQATYTILFSHGNALDIGMIVPSLLEFQSHGFSVFSYDYEGYGTSEGKPTEAHAYEDAYAAYRYLTQILHIPPKHIIVYGHSLGAAMAVELAANKPVAAVILESPFLTAFRTATQIPLLPFDKFNNLEKIKKIRVPILVIQGKEDDVVPFWQGQYLYHQANSPKFFLWVDHANHSDVALVAGKVYWQTINDFVKQNLRQP